MKKKRDMNAQKNDMKANAKKKDLKAPAKMDAESQLRQEVSKWSEGARWHHDEMAPRIEARKG